jgi:hypothetical protein
VENYSDGCIKKWEMCKNAAEIRDSEVTNDYKREIPPMCREGGV